MNSTRDRFPGRPQGIKAPHGATVFEVRWAPKSLKIPHSVLRGYCPCATCQGHSGEIRFREGGSTELRDITPVGNYALCLTWGDGHDSGIYSFEFLWELGHLVEELGEAETIALELFPRGGVVRPQ